MEWFTWLPIAIFAGSIILIALEWFDKTVIALTGALILVLLRILTPHEALGAIDFETIVLLLSMMMVVEVSRQSGIFSWLNVRLVRLTQGNPLAISLLFSLTTAFFSTFLDNVSTVIVMVPLTIELFKGLGKDPKPVVLQEIFMSNIGGALTLIGDPTNIIIGTSAKLSFNDFVFNLWVPVLLAVISLSAIFVITHWQHLKPVGANLRNLLLSMILIHKLEYRFLKIELNPWFIAKTVSVIVLIITSFILQGILGYPVFVLALAGVLLLMLLTYKNVHIEKVLHGVEWSTLLFFAGLFIMVAGVEKTGLLTALSNWIVSATTDFSVLLLIILWGSAFISMSLNNVALVTVMIPVITGIQAQLPHEPHTQLLWWALSLGTVMGGNGTIIGASANVVGCDIAKKNDCKITFFEHFRYAFPCMLITMIICSGYLMYRYYFT